jgi:hypothetical protein
MFGSFGKSHEHLGSPWLVPCPRIIFSMAFEMAIQIEELAILSSTNGTRNDLLLSF